MQMLMFCHRNELQDQREEGLKGFRDGSFPVLVATDVAGRGIDVPDVSPSWQQAPLQLLAVRITACGLCSAVYC